MKGLIDSASFICVMVRAKHFSACH